MSNRNLIKILRAKFQLSLMCKGMKVSNISLSEIPKKWESFLGTEDTWINLEFPTDSDTSACLYKGKKGSIFRPHKHESVVEHLVILNKEGKIKSVTDTQIRIVSFPNSVFFPCGKPHAVEFLEDTEIMVMWHPKKEGWDAEFLGEESLEGPSQN